MSKLIKQKEKTEIEINSLEKKQSNAEHLDNKKNTNDANKEQVTSEKIRKKQKVKTKVKFIHPAKDNSPQAKLDFIIKASNDQIIYFLLYIFTALVSSFLFFIGKLTPDSKVIFFVLIEIVMIGSITMIILCVVNIFRKDKKLKRFLFNNFFEPNFKKQKPTFKYSISKEEGFSLLGKLYDLNSKLHFKSYSTKIEIPFAEGQTVTLANLKEKSHTTYLLAICTLRNFISSKISAENSLPKHLESMKVIESEGNKLQLTSANKIVLKKVLNNSVSKEIEKIIEIYENVSLYIYKSNLFVLIKNVELLDIDSFVGKDKINNIIEASTKICELSKILINISNNIAQIDLMKKPNLAKISKKK